MGSLPQSSVKLSQETTIESTVESTVKTTEASKVKREHETTQSLAGKYHQISEKRATQIASLNEKSQESTTEMANIKQQRGENKHFLVYM